jgi:tetratricopeptide (TPR) repeat protein
MRHSLTRVVDVLLYVLVALTAIVIPLFFSRTTTENFILPKEYLVQLFSCAGLILFALKLTLERFPVSSSPLFLPLLLLLAWSGLSLHWHPVPACGLRDLFGHALIFLYFFSVRATVTTPRRLQILLWLFIGLGTGLAVMNMCEAKAWYFEFNPTTRAVSFASPTLFDVDASGTRTLKPGSIQPASYYFPFEPANWASYKSRGATLGNKNFISLFLGMLAFLPLLLFFHYQSRPVKGLCLAAFVIMITDMLLLYDFAAPFGMGCALLLLGLSLWKTGTLGSILAEHRRAVLVFVIVTIGVSGVLFFSNEATFFSVFRYYWNRPGALQALPRFQDWYSATYLLRTQPLQALLGEGYAGFKHFFPFYQAYSLNERQKDLADPGIARYAHNDWLQLLNELGLIGLLLFLFFLYRCRQLAEMELLRSDSRATRFFTLGIWGSMLSLLSAATTEFPFTLPFTLLYFTLFSGLLSLLTTIFPWTENSDIRLGKAASPHGEPEPAVLLASTTVSLDSATASLAPATISPPDAGQGTTPPDSAGMNEAPASFLSPSLVRILSVTFLPVILFITLTASRLIWRSWSADVLCKQAETLGTLNQPRLLPLMRDRLVEAIRLDPLPGVFYLRLAFVYEGMGEPKEALKQVQNAMTTINHKPLSFSYHSCLFQQSHLHWQLRNPASCLEQAQLGRFMTCGFDRSLFYQYALNALLALNRISDAEPLFQQWLATPFAAKTLNLLQPVGNRLIYCLRLAGEKTRSLAIGNQLWEPSNTDPIFLNLLGNLFSETGSLASGEALLRKALEHDPRSVVGKRDLARTLLKAGKASEAALLVRELQSIPQLPAGLAADITDLARSLESLVGSPLPNSP